MLLRLVLLLAIAGSLVILVWSNLEPIALVFLGIQTPALPLAVWVVGAIAAGVATHVIINILFSLSNYATGRQVRFQVRRAAQRDQFQAVQREPFQPNASSAAAARDHARQTKRQDGDEAWQNWEGFEATGGRQSGTAQPNTVRQPVDDWEIPFSDDWEGTGTRSTVQDVSQNASRAKTGASDRSNYEVNQTSKTSSRSGSTYSYGYSEPDRADADKREKVVDVDYRVIIPPYYPPPQESPSPPEPTPNPEVENADDWFEDDSPSDSGDRYRP